MAATASSTAGAPIMTKAAVAFEPKAALEICDVEVAAPKA